MLNFFLGDKEERPRLNGGVFLQLEDSLGFWKITTGMEGQKLNPIVTAVCTTPMLYVLPKSTSS